MVLPSAIPTQHVHKPKHTRATRSSWYLIAAATMATIAGPRPSRPLHAGTPVDMINPHANITLKRRHRKLSTQGASHVSPSLRTIYFAASISEGENNQTLRSLPQRVATFQIPHHSATSDNKMASPYGYEPLSSDSSSTLPSYSVASNVSVTGQQTNLANTRSDLTTCTVSLTNLKSVIINIHCNSLHPVRLCLRRLSHRNLSYGLRTPLSDVVYSMPRTRSQSPLIADSLHSRPHILQSQVSLTSSL